MDRLRGSRSSTRRSMTTLLLFLTQASVLPAQKQVEKCRLPQRASDTLYSGAVPSGNPARVARLRQILKCDASFYPGVREVFFDSTYTPNLADWVVYIDTAGVVKQALTQHNRVVSPPILRGEKVVYVLAFLEGGLLSADTGSATEQIAAAATRLRARGIGRAEAMAVWNTFFTADGTPRPESFVALLRAIDAVERSDSTHKPLPLLAHAKSEADRRVVLQDLLKELARPWDVAPAVLQREQELPEAAREQLDRLVNLLTQGSIPPLRSPGNSPMGTRTDSVVRAIVDYLAAPEELGRLADARGVLRSTADEKLPPPDSLRFGRNVLQYQRDPFLVRLVTGFGSKLFGAGPDLGDGVQLVDTSFSIALEDLGPDSTGKTHLFVARGKASITDDMWGRLNLYAPAKKRLPKAQSILTNFVTTSGSRFGLSVGAGYIHDERTDSVARDGNGKVITMVDALTNDTTVVTRVSGAKQVVNMYVYGHFQILRRRPSPLRYEMGPIHYGSLSLMTGTNLLRGKVLDEIVLGASLDRLWGSDFTINVGVVRLGSEAGDPRTLEVSKEYVYRFFLGGGFQL
jgi:hypothetical protein